MDRRRDPRRAMHVHADISGLRHQRFTGMESHSHAHDDACRALERRQGALRLDRRHGIRRPRKRDEERITLAVDFVSTPAAQRRTHEPVMVGQHRGITISEFPQQTRAPLDVAEEEGDGPGRERTRLAHVGVRASRGSRRSRMPSPIRFRPRTATAIVSPGQIAIQGAM